jgi:glycosyltransferase involved in cell wall biosynthesis
MKISATIITFNEEAHIREACASLAWADEIVVVDSQSTDQTAQFATQSGARVITRDWPGFAAQKQFASEAASHDWIFSLDADERVSDELRASIETLRSMPDDELGDGYLISRRSFYQGRWIGGGGWYPDRQLRFFRKSLGRWEGEHIHESVKLKDGRIEKLEGDILHYSVRDAAHHHRMIGERYAPLAARQMFETGRRATVLKIATAAPLAFLRCYILKAGFRDGLAGLSIASFAAHHAFLKHLMLWEMQKKEGSRQ